MKLNEVRGNNMSPSIIATSHINLIFRHPNFVDSKIPDFNRDFEIDKSQKCE